MPLLFDVKDDKGSPRTIDRRGSIPVYRKRNAGWGVLHRMKVWRSKQYDKSKPTKYLSYLDANNLYGWAITKRLPKSRLRWMTRSEIERLDLGKYDEESKKGLILEVDLEYPEKLHKKQKDYPLAPEKLEIEEEMLLDCCKDIKEKYGIKVGGVRKLVTNLRDKKEYVMYYRSLQLYMSKGMRLKRCIEC